MQHISKFGPAHKKFDSSRVLFTRNECAKISKSSQDTAGHHLTKSAPAHFDECQSTESAEALSLGIIAIKMMQNGIPPDFRGEVRSATPRTVVSRGVQLLEVVFLGTLNDIDK